MKKNKSFRNTVMGRNLRSSHSIRSNSIEMKNESNVLGMVKEVSDILTQDIGGKKFNPMKKTLNYFKIIEKRDIVSRILGQDLLADEAIFDVILILYGGLQFRNGDTQALVKLIISYERVELFDMVVTHISEILETGAYGYLSEDESSDEESETKVAEADKQAKKNGNVDKYDIYDYDLIVSDAFSYSISINKLHITFYLFNQYQRSVFGNSEQCIESIITSIQSESATANKVLSIDERLFIMTKLMKYMDHKVTYTFLDLMQEIVSAPAENNLFVYMPNTLKSISKIIYIIQHLVKLHPSLSFKGNKIRETLTNIGNNILHKNTDLAEVEDIINDVLYSGTKVIDVIANNSMSEFMNNPLLDSVVSNIYVGSYQRDFFLKKSLPYHILEKEFDFDPDDDRNKDSSTLVLCKPKKSTVRGRHSKKGQCRAFLGRLCQGYHERNTFKRGKKYIVGHQFMFKIWSQSPDTQHFIETFFILVIGLLLVYYSNNIVDSEEEASSQSNTINQINNGSQTGDVATETAKLETISIEYYNDTITLMVFNTF